MDGYKNPIYNNVEPATQGIHAADHMEVTPDVATPMSVTTTFKYGKLGAHGNNYGHSQNYIYSKTDTPTRRQVETILGTLCGGFAVMYSSGVTGLFGLLMHYRPMRIVCNNGYQGSKDAFKMYQKLVPHAQILPICADLQEGDFVFLETPVNPTGEVVDVRFYSLKTQAAGARLIVDATLAPPPLFNPLSLGADVVLHSASKYLGGHSDVLAGVVVTRCAKSASRLRNERTTVGSVPGSMEPWLLLRSLKTLELRVIRQSQNCQQLVAWLAMATRATRPCEADGLPVNVINRVYHASLQRFGPNFDVCQQYPRGFGAVFTIEFNTEQAANMFPRQLRLAANATSLGGVETTSEWRRAGDKCVDPRWVRVSVGVENVKDLKNDFRLALNAVSQIRSINKL